MNEKEVETVMDMVVIIGNLLKASEIHFERYIEAAERDLTVAMFFDPTLYMRGAGVTEKWLKATKILLRAAKELRPIMEELREFYEVKKK